MFLFWIQQLLKSIYNIDHKWLCVFVTLLMTYLSMTNLFLLVIMLEIYFLHYVMLLSFSHKRTARILTFTHIVFFHVHFHSFIALSIF